MRTSTLIAVCLAVCLAVIVLVAVCVVIGNFDEFSVKRALWRAQAGYYGNKWDEALADLEYCVDTKPRFAPPYELTACIYLKKGNIDTAEKVYREAIDKCGAKSTPTSVLGLAVIDALRAAANIEEVRVLKDAAKKIEDLKGDVEFESDVLVSAAAVKVLAGQTEDAARMLKSLEGKEKTFSAGAVAVMRNTQALLYYHKNRRKDAMTAFGRASAVSGSWKTPEANLSAMSLRIVTSEETSRENLALVMPTLFGADCGAFTEDQAYMYRNAISSIAYMRLGREFYDKAIGHLDKAIDTKPDEPWAKLNKAAIMLLHEKGAGSEDEKSKLLRESQRLYKQVLKADDVSDDTKQLVLNGLGMISLKKGKDKKALKFFEEAYAINADDSLVCRNLGTLYLGRADYKRGREFLEKSAKLLPGQEDVDEALKVLQAGPVIESASVRYTVRPRPVVGVAVTINSCPTTLDNAGVSVAFDDIPAYFKIRPNYITCTPMTALQEGKHKINVTIIDAAGNKSEKAFDLNMDISPPRAEAVVPARDGALKGPRPKITISLTDDLSKVDLTTLHIRYKSSAETEIMVIERVIEKGRYAYNMPDLEVKATQAVLSPDRVTFMPKTDLAAGKYRLLVQVKDIMGNAVSERWGFEVTE